MSGQVEDLRLDTSHYALQVADSLAIMHWDARIDAADVEFILDAAPCLAQEPLPAVARLKRLKENSSTIVDAVQSQAAATHMWLLNFNQCQPLPIDQEGVDQGVKRFFDNDPYYPCPLAATGITGEGLWELFANRYLENVGNYIGADQECRVLPNEFILKSRGGHAYTLGRKSAGS
ncbi:MAG: hypothetical protein Q9161_006264 [Pseudevernia consocians]